MPLFELCTDATLERDAASGLPLKAMAAAYVANLRVASAAAKGEYAAAGEKIVLEIVATPKQEQVVLA